MNRCDPRSCPEPSPRWTTWRRLPSAARKTVTFTEHKAGTLYYINHKQFDHNRIDFRAKLHTVQEWTIKNDSDEVHSFHIHTNDFQVMSINGKRLVNYGLRTPSTSLHAETWSSGSGSSTIRARRSCTVTSSTTRTRG